MTSASQRFMIYGFMIYPSGRPAFAGTLYSLKRIALQWSVLQEVSDAEWAQESESAGPRHMRPWETRLQTSVKIVQRAQVCSGVDVSVGGWLRATV